MNILLLMGGERVEHKDGRYPIYMAEIGDKLIIEEQIKNCVSLSPDRMIFCIKSEDIRDFHIDDVVRQLSEKAVCVTINGPTQGAICTALLASSYIDNDDELILMAVDDFIEDNFTDIMAYFRDNNCEAGVVSFTSVHPRYSYARLDEEGFVAEVAEKHPISRNALASVYYYRRGRDFVECAKDVIRKDNRINDVFYVSQAINEMILKQRRIGIYKIANSQFHPVKTEVQLAQYMLELNNRRENAV